MGRRHRKPLLLRTRLNARPTRSNASKTAVRSTSVPRTTPRSTTPWNALRSPPDAKLRMLVTSTFPPRLRLPSLSVSVVSTEWTPRLVRFFSCSAFSKSTTPPLSDLTLPPSRCCALWSLSSLMVSPNLKTVKELIYKRGFAKVNGQRIPITTNDIIEQNLGRFGLICVEDIIHEIYTCGPHFKEANSFLWAFKLSSPKGGYNRKRNHFIEGGDAGNREHLINSFVQKMNGQ